MVYNRTLEYDFEGNRRHAFWRDYSDAVNRRLLAAWRPISAEVILKTDAFDEAWSSGLAPTLDPAKLTVIDIAPAVLHRAAIHAPGLRASCADVRSLPFRDDCFDWIVSTSTLDHFASEAEIAVSLRELHRVLRPSGELLLTLDNPLNPFVALRNAMPGRWSQSAGLSSYDVGVTWSPWRLRREVQACGFTIIDASTTGQCPRVLAVLLAGLVGERGRRAILNLSLACENLRRLPTRVFTGHFTAIRAVKR